MAHATGAPQGPPSASQAVVRSDAPGSIDLTTWRWTCTPLAAMRSADLLAWLRLRSEVFVLEQRCVYLDPDAQDLDAWHLLGWQGRYLAAGARLLPPGTHAVLEGLRPAIGRVVTASWARGHGAGRRLMSEALAACEAHWPQAGVVLSAQAHLVGFYASLGFLAVGEPHVEDGIPHQDMCRAG